VARNAQKEFLIGQSSRSHATSPTMAVSCNCLSADADRISSHFVEG